MTSRVLFHLFLTVVLFHVTAAVDCKSYISSGEFKDHKSCNNGQTCCGTCDNRYCCSGFFGALSEDEQDACTIKHFSYFTIGLIILGIVAFVTLILSCCCCPCCCLYNMCRKPRPVVGMSTTTVVNTQCVMQQPPVQGGQYPPYQPVPTQPPYGGQPYLAQPYAQGPNPAQPYAQGPYPAQPYAQGPYQAQPYAPGPPPPYQTVAGPGYPSSQAAYPPTQAGFAPMPQPTDTSKQPPGLCTFLSRLFHLSHLFHLVLVHLSRLLHMSHLHFMFRLEVPNLTPELIVPTTSAEPKFPEFSVTTIRPVSEFPVSKLPVCHVEAEMVIPDFPVSFRFGTTCGLEKDFIFLEIKIGFSIVFLIVLNISYLSKRKHVTNPVIGVVVGVIAVVSCCCCSCCCLHKMCRKPRPVVETSTTTVVNTPCVMQQPPVQGGQYPPYQPVPTQPPYGGQPYPAESYAQGPNPAQPYEQGPNPAQPYAQGPNPAQPYAQGPNPAQPYGQEPYPAQPYAPGHPPPYQTAAGPGYPNSQAAYPPTQEGFAPMPQPTDTSKPPYNPAFMQPPPT
nr:uncharacterized protein LOC129454262 [Misgurnus anguillicaudatus]